jgi:Fe-coproporphyrin III synthase
MKQFYKATKDLMKSNFTRLDSPVKITFAITYACTFLCKTCNIGKNYLDNPKKIKENELTEEEIAETFGKAKPSWIQITGGEPFMRDMYSIIKKIKEKNSNLYAVTTTTNGFTTRHIVDSVKKILDLKIPRFVVSVSIDGFEQGHEDIRRIKNSFEHCIATFNELKKLESKRFNVFISYTSSPHNMGNLENFILKMKEKYHIDAKHIHMNLFHTSNHYYGNQDQSKTEDYNQKVLSEIAVYKKHKKGNDFNINFLEKRYSKLSEEFVKTGKSPLPCKALNSSCFIDPYGNVFPCIVWSKKIGNVKDFDYNLNTMWQLQAAKETQKNAENLNCPQCWTPCEAYQTIAGNLRKTLMN